MSIVGEAALQVSLQHLVNKLFSTALNYANKYVTDVSDIEKCHEMFKDIRNVLQDAERKRFTNPQVKEWLYDLEDLSYDAEDILQAINYKVLHRMVEEQNKGSSGRVKSAIRKFTDKVARINSKFNKIVDRLEVLIERKNQMELFSRNMVNDSSSSSSDWNRDSGPLLTEHAIYGRETEKSTIIELLLKQDSRIGVIPIVGMGGSGKTTLAQDIFNDARIAGHFDKKAWVYVSKSYDMRRIIKAIFEAATLKPCRFDDANLIKVRVSEALREKKFFLVLDDLWNSTYEDWADLRAVFNLVAIESKIVVTTRNASVADMVKTVDYEILKPLSDEDCWKVLCEHSGIDLNQMSNSKFETIGKKILNKCSGLPLAAKSIGGVLRYKSTEEQWDAVLHDITSNTNEREDKIMAILRTSYYDLPSTLKRCFASCVFFPEDKEFVEDEVVPIWMGLGLIHEDNAEETGYIYFRQLVARSMLLPAGNLFSGFPNHMRMKATEFATGPVWEKQCFVMHDLNRDLALEISGKLYHHVPLYYNCLSDDMSRTRHLSFWNDSLVSIAKMLLFLANEKKPISLRSFMPSLTYSEFDYLLCEGDFLPYNIIEKNVLSKLFPKLKYLRMLCLRGYGNSELPESLGELRLLRYLDLSGSEIIKLPKSTTSLYNLEILILRYCLKLRELPASIGNLINLRYLDITKSTRLNVVNAGVEELPEGVKNLRKLRKLSDFIISQGKGNRIVCLENVNRLRGELRISGLNNVNSFQDARLARLSEKKLKCLELIGSKGEGTVDYAVLEELQPHQDLKKLFIVLYNGPSCFPSWVESMIYLTHLGLERCDKVTSLPVLGSFPCLECLSIADMPSLEEIDLSIGMEYNSTFAYLKELEFCSLDQFRNWTHSNQIPFPRLSRLSISDCRELSGDISVLESMESLEEFQISGCTNLAFSLPKLPRLKNLLIWYCKYVSCSEDFDLQSLEKLKLSFLVAMPLLNSSSAIEQLNYLKFISDLPALSFASPLFMGKIRCGLNRARFLAVDDCFLPAKYDRDTIKPTWVLENCSVEVSENHLRGETGVEILELDHQLIEHLPQWICNANFLTTLTLNKCPLLKTLSLSGDFPEKLTSIEVTECQELKSVSETGNLPAGLKKLLVRDCPKLEIILTCHPVDIQGLQSLEIEKGCPLVIRKFPDLLHKFNSLSELSVTKCTRDASEAICKSLRNLRRLKLCDSPGIVSFPSVERTEVCLRSLTDLRLVDFPDLKQLCCFRAFWSLQLIELERCPVLEKLFEEELPPSVRLFVIDSCPLIENMLNSRDEQLLRKISHTPVVSNGQRLSFI